MALDFSLSEEQELVKSTVKDLLKRFEGREAELRRKVLKERQFPQEIWDALAEAGFLGCLIPPEYGGNAMGMLALAIAVEEMASLGFGNTILILTAMDSNCIVRTGNEDVKRRFLPEIAKGARKLCFAVTEPDAGSNTFRLKTIARREGDCYRLNGSKVFITGFDVADYCLVVARTLTIDEVESMGMPKAYGLSLFLVDTKAEGITKQALPTRGIEGMTQYQIFFDNVRVPAEDLLGAEHGGAMSLFNSLNPERILAAATACGMVRFALDKSCAYARERKVFKDRPIGAYQAIQHPLAEIRIELDAVRLLTYRAAWALDHDEAPGIVGTYANMAKFKAAELAIAAADRAIETHGGYGFSEDCQVIYLWEAARLLRTAPITREMILNYISEHVLELPRSY